MKKLTRYIKFFSDTTFTEAVINVDKYSQQLLDIFNKREKNILYKDHKLLALQMLLNKMFKSFRVKFKLHPKHELQKHEDYRYGLIRGETLFDKYSTILISCNPNILDIQKDRKIYEEFIKRCIKTIKHELIHRLQIIDIKDLELKKTFSSSNKNQIEYLSNYHEIMSWAWEALGELRFSGFSDESIKNKLKNLKFSTIDSLSLWRYLRIFKKDSETRKRFYKYIYMYLDGNFSDKVL